MNNEINYKNNPLHGVSLKKLLMELVDYYGFDILFAYLNINCFRKNPSIASSVKFLKKTDWAREKVEAFYLYTFKNLPGASAEQLLLSPRDRIIPEGQTPGQPAELSLEDAQRLHDKRAKKSIAYDQDAGHQPDRGKRSETQPAYRKKNTARKDGHDTSKAPAPSVEEGVDPWAKWKK